MDHIDEQLTKIRVLMERAVVLANEAVAMPVTSWKTEQDQRDAMAFAVSTLHEAAAEVKKTPLAELPDHRWHLDYTGEEDERGSFFYPKWEYPTLQSAQDKFRLEGYQRDELRRKGKGKTSAQADRELRERQRAVVARHNGEES